jgi:hypothetical protein
MIFTHCGEGKSRPGTAGYNLKSEDRAAFFAPIAVHASLKLANPNDH